MVLAVAAISAAAAAAAADARGGARCHRCLLFSWISYWREITYPKFFADSLFLADNKFLYYSYVDFRG
jgi:hypothetical protein